MFSAFMHSPYRFLFAAAVMAALLCLFPVTGDAPPEAPAQHALQHATPMPAAIYPQDGQPASADLSERTAAGCYLHRTLHYAPCGHSVQRRESLPAQLVGLSRTALEKEIGRVIPGAAVKGFSASEVDIALSADIPCPLHWVLRAGEDGMLCVLQNRMGESLEAVRQTDVPLSRVQESERQDLIRGRIFDDVQAMEGYLESLSS